jgi:hypothetical protein
VPEQSSQRIANEIDDQDREREPSSPLSVLGKPDRARPARGSDDEHQRNRQARADL